MSNLKVYNRTIGEWEEIKVDTRLTTLKNTVVLPANMNYVNIGIPTYNPADDNLAVFKDGDYLEEGVKYTFNQGLMRIYKIDNTDWSVGSVFNFVAYKNVERLLPTADSSLLQDGSITESKVAPGLKISPSLTDREGHTFFDLKARLLDFDDSFIALDAKVDELDENIENFSNSVLKFGAKGDGITDDTLAIQATIDYVNSIGGGIVFMPTGKYLITNGIRLYSNITLRGSGVTTEIKFNDLSKAIYAEGSFGTEFALAQNKTQGDTSIMTLNANGFKSNDLVFLMSQRDSLSSDATDDWRLGYATPNAQGCYFGEFLRVSTVSNDTTFNFTNGLIFPNYRTNKTQETSALARNSSTVQKLNQVENIIVQNLSLKGTSSRAIDFKYAFNCKVDNVSYYSEGDGMFISFQHSLNCQAEKCMAYCSPIDSPSNHYSRNSFKTISSQNCGFVNCYGENCTQTFDQTYLAGFSPSVHCYVKDCITKGATDNAMTTHGGTYGSLVTDNMFVDNMKNGVSIRGRNSIINNNRVSGANVYYSSGYGINLYEGWARDCVISGNTVTGFAAGIAVMDASDYEESFKWCGAIISNNTITYCNRGVRIQRNESHKITGTMGIIIQGNVIKNMIGDSAKPIHLTSYVTDIKILGNVLAGGGTANGGIYAEANTSQLEIDNNTIYNVTAYGIWLEEPTDFSAFPTGSTTYLGTNRFVSVDNKYKIYPGVKVQNYQVGGNVMSFVDNEYDLGSAATRWKNIYAATATINTSDRNSKYDISDDVVGLDLVKKLRPVSYKYIDNTSDRTHHGLIAQEVEDAIESLGIDVKYFAAITKSPKLDDQGNETSEFTYGLRYTELMAHLIKAIQELDAKVNPVTPPTTE